MNEAAIKAGMKDKRIPAFTRKNALDAIRKTISAIGEETYLIICLEEICELIEVIAENIDGDGSYVHTAEEIADVKFCSMIIQEIFHVKNKDIGKIDTCKKKRASMKALRLLCESHQLITKYLRKKSEITDMDDYIKHKIIPCIEDMNDAAYMLMIGCGVKSKDVEKILAIKVARQHQRMKDRYGL